MRIYLVFLLALFFSGAPSPRITIKKDIARCYGYSPCTACSNCSACKHCTAGGTCGVCEKVKVKTRPPTNSNKQPLLKQTTSSGQCQATTKKGSRCSRNSRSGGYCWQHGG